MPNWRRARLGDVLQLDVSYVPVRRDGSYAMAGVYNRGRGLFIREVLRGADTSYKQLHRIRQGQVVMSRLKAWEGAVAVVAPELDGLHLSPEFPTFSCTDGLLPSYMAMLCTRPEFWEALQAQSRGMGGRRERVHPDRFLHIEVDLPPYEDQKRIVDVAVRADQLVLMAHRLEASARALARQVRASVFEAPSETDQSRLDELAEVTLGRQRSPKHTVGDHILPYLRAANVKDGRLDLDDVLRMNFSPSEQRIFALRAGDILISEGAGSRAAVGASAVWRGELPGTVCFQNTLLRVRANGRTDPRWLQHWCAWAYETGTLAAVATGTNILHIGQRRAAAMSVPRLPLVQQAAYADLMESAEHYANCSSAYVRCALALREALVGSLLSGQHVIPDRYVSFSGAI